MPTSAYKSATSGTSTPKATYKTLKSQSKCESTPSTSSAFTPTFAKNGSSIGYSLRKTPKMIAITYAIYATLRNNDAPNNNDKHNYESKKNTADANYKK